ncbi:MAG TPA: FtsX-like permease family protein [Acidimicrobiia bacterium]
MLKVTLKGLLGHKLRLALTVLAIMLGTGLIAGSYVFTDTLDRVFSDLFSQSLAGIDAQVTGDASDELSSFTLPERLPESLVQEIAALDQVEAAVGTVAGLVTLIDPSGEALGGFGPPTIGTSWSDVASPLTVREGSAPAGNRDLVIDASSADRLDIEIGDEVGVIALGEQERFRVVGTIGLGGSSNFGGATFVSFTYGAAQQLFDAAGFVDTISVVGAGDIGAEALVAAIEEIAPENTSVVDAETAAEEQLSGFKEALDFVNTFLLAFGYVSLFVGGFLIFNTFQVIVAQRTKELALLRAIGATRRQVRRMVLAEALIVSVIGSLFGVVFGVVLAIVIREAFSRFGGEIPATTPQILPRTIVIAVLSGVVVTVVSALIPAYRASAVPPIAALRQVTARPTSRLFRIVMIAGSVIATLGAGVISAGLFLDPPEQIPRAAFVGVGAALLFIGLAILSAAFARPLGRFLGAPIRAAFGAIGRLATENAVRNPGRTAVTSAALMVGVALMVFVTILASSLAATTDKLIEDTFKTDLVVQPIGFGAAGLSPQVADRIEALDQIEEVVRLRQGPMLVEGDVEFVSASELSRIENAIDIEILSGDLASVGADGVALSENVASDLDVGIGDTLDVEFARTGEQTLTVRVVFVEAGPGSNIYLDLEGYRRNFTEDFDQSLFVKFDRSFDSASAREAVEEVLDEFPGTTSLDQSEFADQAITGIRGFVGLVYALLALALVIAFVGIVNTLLLSVIERTREIGLLRAVGSTRKQVRRMVTWESVIIAVYGALLGTVVGIVLARALVEALDTDEIVFRLPIVQIALAVVLAMVAGVIAAIYPAQRASRLNVLEAIAYE